MVSNLDHHSSLLLVADSLNDFSSPGAMNLNESYFLYMFYRISPVNHHDFSARMLVPACCDFWTWALFSWKTTIVAPLHHHGDLLLAQDGRRPRTVSPNRDGSITKGDERMTKGWSFWCED